MLPMTDIFDEFDQITSRLNPKGEELLKLGAEFEIQDLPAAIAPPHMQEAIIVDPNTGLCQPGSPHPRFRQALFHAVPVPLRIKAFYLWIDHGDCVTVAGLLGLKVSQVHSLKKQDQWESRAKDLSHELDHTIGAIWKRTKSATLQFLLSVMSEIDPARMAGMMDPAGLASLIKACASVGSESKGTTVINTTGPTQVNAGAGPGPLDPSRPLKERSGEELAAVLRSSGLTHQPPPPRGRGGLGVVDVESSPGNVSTPPPPLPADAGGTDVGKTRAA
jgi:hypothetical protein